MMNGSGRTGPDSRLAVIADLGNLGISAENHLRFNLRVRELMCEIAGGKTVWGAGGVYEDLVQRAYPDVVGGDDGYDLKYLGWEIVEGVGESDADRAERLIWDIGDLCVWHVREASVLLCLNESDAADDLFRMHSGHGFRIYLAHDVRVDSRMLDLVSKCGGRAWSL